MTSNPRTWVVLVSSTLLLAACDLPFLVDEQTRIDAKREAEGKAVGSACRHAGRALEECYERSPKTSKAAIFAGWRDMDGYMRENKIENAEPPGAEKKSGETKANESKPSAAEKSKEAAAAAAPAKPAAKH